MLRALEIRDMLIIDRLDLGFQPGLNVLTGETGAGKSILLDSLGFVLGWRGRAELVREGADQGEVVAVFDLSPNHPARDVLQEAGFPAEDELILRRINMRDGRKTAWVNDRRCSGEILRALAATLVELHGQHDDRGLLNARGHRAIVDDYAGNDAALAKVRRAWREKGAAQSALEAAEAALALVREEEDFLRHAVAEMDALHVEAGEDAQLDVARRKMQGAERLRADVIKAATAIGDNGAEGAAGDALRWLEGVVDESDGVLEAPIAAVEIALNELGEAVDAIHRSLEVLDFEPYALENCEERLFAIRALARKHGIVPDDLPGLTEVLREKLTALDQGDADIRGLIEARDSTTAAYFTAADALRTRRAKAAHKLDKAVMGELTPLKMERAVFETKITDAEPGIDGTDMVVFQVATNPGAPAGPLGKIASGGELSRFLLALKVCLTRDSGGITMIFDEIDRGVGGATADAVGRRLEALARETQVLVVTHSPQVAARGAHHWRVQKATKGAVTLSTVVPLDEDARVDEIARMLSGDTITTEARAAAERLMA